MEMTVQTYCKQYRAQTLKMTLEQMQELKGVNAKTISGFENGNSNNVNLFKLYYKIGNAFDTYKFHENILRVLIR